jgi:hypothetical protein
MEHVGVVTEISATCHQVTSIEMRAGSAVCPSATGLTAISNAARTDKLGTCRLSALDPCRPTNILMGASTKFTKHHACR